MMKISELGISPWPWVSESGPLATIVYENAKVTSSVCAITGKYRKNDARLIAAAPELYDCLHEAVEQSCHECEDDTIEHCRSKCHIARWRDALAKASGEREVEE